MATVKTSGQYIEILFRSGPIWNPRKGYEGGSLDVEAHLTGRVVAAPDGAVLSVDLVTLSGLARGLVRLTPIVAALGAIATLSAVVLAPALAVIPLVVVSGGVSLVAVGCLVLRWSWRQKADEIARLLLVTDEATGSTTADVPEEPRHGLVRLLEPWLRDIPGSMIIDQMHRIGGPSGHQ